MASGYLERVLSTKVGQKVHEALENPQKVCAVLVMEGFSREPTASEHRHDILGPSGHHQLGGSHSQFTLQFPCDPVQINQTAVW